MLRRLSISLPLALTVVMAVPFGLLSVRVSGADPLGYNQDVRPILADHCFSCHGADSAARQGDLRLDQRDAAMAAGAIAPGKPDASELVARIFSDDPDLVMPPPAMKKDLSAEQKEILKKWIASGAEYQPHWSFIAPTRPTPPAVKDESWVKNSIDRFVLAALEQHGLTPAPQADPAVLFRRLHLDITGLVPSPADAQAFARDFAANPEESLSTWIDRLMNSNAWGEHRARYWLDAARYGDTHGLHFDNYREMWPYRDWVIRAFNANMPFDQFTVEQLAGDLLPNPSDDQLIATGFQRCNITTNEGGTIDEENLALYATDRVQTLGWVYLGLTTNCCQCHDHKFDPITMKDYYSLAAYFRNTTQPAKDGNVKDGRGPMLIVPSMEDRPRWNSLPALINEAVAKREERKKIARSDFEQWIASATPDALDQDLPKDQMIVHAPLNEGAGNEVTNTCQSPPSFKATGVVNWIPEGKIGPAPVMKLGGTFDLGELGDFEKDQAFSYGAWIRPDRNGVFGGIIARMDEKHGYRGWDLFQADRAISVHIVDSWPDNAIKVTTSKALLKPKEWQHVFVTYDGSQKPSGIKIYVNGVEEAVKIDQQGLKPDASIRTKTPLRLGQRSDSQVFDGGALQDARVYTRTLSAPEVKALADIAPLRAILATDQKERKPEQQNALYDHYLLTRDAHYPKFAKIASDLESEREAIRLRSPVTHIQTEKKDSSPMAHVLMRGEYDKPGEAVEAAVPASLHPLPKDAPKNRLGLAQWLVAPESALTARVTVNRFWQEIFGQGIVVTTEDFGIMGALPSHPELLDWMSLEFRESGWNVKKLYKQIFMSATYRQAAVTTPEKLEKDRSNALLSRGPRFRMDAEMVRDVALSASDLLSTKMFGPGTRPYQPEGIWDIVGLPGGDTRNYVQDKGENLYRRTLYNFWKRMAPPPSLEAFNAPSREVCVVKRERTNTPLQALVTLNDPQFIEAARHLAQIAMASQAKETAGPETDGRILDVIAQRLLTRSLSTPEQTIALTSLKELLDYYQSKPDDAKALIGVGESKPDATLEPAQLAAWTMVCNQIMNLDEALNK